MSNPESPTRPKYMRLEIEEYKRLDAIKDRLEKELVKAEGIIEWVNKDYNDNPLHYSDLMMDKYSEAIIKHNELSRYLGLELKYPEYEDKNEK